MNGALSTDQASLFPLPRPLWGSEGMVTATQPFRASVLSPLPQPEAQECIYTKDGYIPQRALYGYESILQLLPPCSPKHPCEMERTWSIISIFKDEETGLSTLSELEPDSRRGKGKRGGDEHLGLLPFATAIQGSLIRSWKELEKSQPPNKPTMTFFIYLPMTLEPGSLLLSNVKLPRELRTM